MRQFGTAGSSFQELTNSNLNATLGTSSVEGCTGFHLRRCYTGRMSNAEPPTQLTPELEKALDAHGGVVQGQSFVLMRTDVVLSFFGYDSKEDLARELWPAFTQANRGELATWDVDAFLERMHRSHNGDAERCAE